MVLKKFLLCMQGTVRVCVTGASIERFFNLCSRHDVTLYDICRRDLGAFDATMTLTDFKRLRALMGRTGCRVHLLRRGGVPFVAHRFRKRYALFGGLVALGALAWVLTSFIWVIHMPAADGLPVREIERNLEQLGVHAGMSVSALDAKGVQQAMLTRMPELAFIALNRHGNRIDIELHARVPKPEMLDREVNTDVRATKAGVLSRIDARDGQARFKAGQTVEAGDIVISSLVDATTDRGQPRLTHAWGEAWARTWYENTARRATVTARKTYTGRETTRYALVFGKKRLNLYFGSSISQGSCDKIVTERKIVIADSLELPVRLVCETRRFYTTHEVTENAEALRDTLTDTARQRLRASIDGDITMSTGVLRPLEGGAEITLYAECLEQIGRETVTTQQLPPPAAAEGEAKK